MKKRILLSLLVVCLILSIAACGQSKQEALWTISIEGAKAEPVSFTNIDGDKIGTKEITATQVKKDGTQIEQKWKGYSLKEVLASYGVTDFKTVTVKAGDDYSKDLTPEMVNSEGTILGIMVDGTALTEADNKVQLVVNGQSSSYWIKNVVKIIVNK